MRLTSLFSLSALSCVLVVTGCSMMQSPVVGDWSGTMTANSQSGGFGAMIAGAATMALGNAPATLTLRKDGTGYLKIPNAPERAVTWKMDGERVLLSGMGNASSDKSSSGIISGNGNSASANSSNEPLIGKLSEDKKTLTFDLGPVKFDMKKQEK